MWTMTVRGFFSAVQKPGDAKDEMLTVRARDKADLVNLKDLLPNAKPYQAKHATDYPWRIRVPQKDWAMAMASMALEINYSNFKDEIKVTQGPDRAKVYGRVWGVMLDVDPDHKSFQAPYGGFSDSYDTGGAYGTSAYAERVWEPGDRAYDKFKGVACTVVEGGTKPTVHYDGEPDSVKQKVQLAKDLVAFREVGMRVYDEFAGKYGEIMAMKPLTVRYDDGKVNTQPVFPADLLDPSSVEEEAKKKPQSAASTGSGQQLQLPGAPKKPRAKPKAIRHRKK